MTDPASVHLADQQDAADRDLIHSTAMMAAQIVAFRDTLLSGGINPVQADILTGKFAEWLWRDSTSVTLVCEHE